MYYSTPGFLVLHHLPEFTQLMTIESVLPSNHLILYRPLLLLPSIFPNIRVFFKKLALSIKWPKNWSFSFSISPSDEYSGLISSRTDWFVLRAVQGALKGLLPAPQHPLQPSAFFMVQLSGPYMTTGKTIGAAIWIFVHKVTSLVLNTLYRLIIVFLLGSKHLLISWL